MAKVKDNRPVDKISKSKSIELKNISFSFKYQTSNKTYCFKYFNNSKDSHKAYSNLFEKLYELSQIDMNVAKSRGKTSGCEPMPYSRFSTSFKSVMNGVEIISKDSTLSVFRFCQNDYRLICKTDTNHSNLLYIIGCDFDYSSYNHG